ncbi:Rne/Rng family ribonuclease [Solimonas sp. K1W22B-7]|uniref:Rne/Rng family ribonuclease n=1 Tax=Solimonas sp. K1W22B-7 TaxID=2303331 RepID=UPI000E32DAF8|nr:Rne/Rng family ribonuclease [Solimonas sp. K1W22B-7]AXQ29129.1 Rne/Rng family ribonuclease [Solimonas sp. K1W22B-7]
MKRILINATQREELRVAIVDGQKLHDLDIEHASREQKKGNIYKGRITRVEPSLEACFVDYGGERHGFLPVKEIVRSYFKGDGKNLRDQLDEGQEIIVQVEKEERGNKGAALTTFVSLAGRYLVLMPNNPRAGGISRRADGDEREEAKEALNQLNLPDGMGLIIRSNGVGRTVEELQWDLDHRVGTWNAIIAEAAKRQGPFLIYQENNIVMRALRDYLRADIGEVIVDNPEIYEEAREQLQYSTPQDLPKLKQYNDETPLFQRFQVESQIELAHERNVRLPSGGSIVIDHTEALTAIDINSAKATGGRDIEETAFNTNLEAAEEIARQLRLRDLGGLIVVDFIDMASSKNQKEVEKRLERAVEMDRARIQLGRISRFGLLELSRQRLRPTLAEHTQVACPRCSGRGHIRSVESLALSILRLIEEEAMKERTGRVIAQVPVDVGTFLLNEKRLNVREIEARCRVHIAVVPNPTLHTPNFEIKRVRADHLAQDGNSGISYVLAQNFDAAAQEEMAKPQAPTRPLQEPAVKQIVPATPAPIVIKQEIVAAPAPVQMVAVPTESVWTRLMRWLGFGAQPVTEAPPAKAPQDQRRRDEQRRDGRGGNNRGERGERGRDQNRDQNRGQQQGQQRRDGQQGPRRDGQQQNPQQQKNRDGQQQNPPQKNRDGQQNPPRRDGQQPQQNRGEGQQQNQQKGRDGQQQDRQQQNPQRQGRDGQQRRDGRPERPQQTEQLPLTAEGAAAELAAEAAGLEPEGTEGHAPGGRSLRGRRNRRNRGRGGEGRGEGQLPAAAGGVVALTEDDVLSGGVASSDIPAAEPANEAVQAPAGDSGEVTISSAIEPAPEAEAESDATAVAEVQATPVETQAPVEAQDESPAPPAETAAPVAAPAFVAAQPEPVAEAPVVETPVVETPVTAAPVAEAPAAVAETVEAEAAASAPAAEAEEEVQTVAMDSPEDVAEAEESARKFRASAPASDYFKLFEEPAPAAAETETSGEQKPDTTHS